MNLRRVDLNLLPILTSLLRESSVTRAARELGLTQAAVSQALARLRLTFDDPLLVRQGMRMQPTPLAKELLPALEIWSRSTQTLLAGGAFDPSKTETEFVITANDYVELTLMPRLIADLTKAAPKARFALRSVEGIPLDSPEFVEGRVHLAIVGAALEPGPFETRPLFEDRFVAIARHGHAIFSKPLTTERFVDWPHALVLPQGRGTTGPVDLALRSLGYRRTIALTITRFTALPDILANSDLVAAVPERFAGHPDTQRSCTQIDLPFESPRFTINLAWHRRYSRDAALSWLRSAAISALSY